MWTVTRETAKVAALVAGGAVIGAGLGMLFAPKSGVETRRDVVRYAKRAQVGATRVGRAVQSRIHGAVERSKALMHKTEEKPVPEAA